MYNMRLQYKTYVIFLPLLLTDTVLTVSGPVNLNYGKISDLEEARRFIDNYEIRAKELCHLSNLADYNYENNLTDARAQVIKMELQKRQNDFAKEIAIKANTFAWQDFKNVSPDIFQMFQEFTYRGVSALSEEKRIEYEELVANSEGKFGMAEVCCYKKTCKECSMNIEPGLTLLMENSQDYEELLHAWVEWRNAAGGCSSRKPYLRLVSLENEIAILNGINNAAEAKHPGYDVEKLWAEMKPFYQQLHAFVRRKLIDKYPEKIRPDGPIPAHILGNMWAQSWENIFTSVTPYPEKPPLDLTPVMRQKSVTVRDMFLMAEEFFTSLGLDKMTPEFWKNSIFEKPTGREIICHAGASDMCDGKDFRIKMCTRKTMEDFLTIHHEMGHIQYYMQYAHQPYHYQDGASAGFHEAVGDAIALSVSAPGHFAKIGFPEDTTDDEERDINHLLSKALENVPLMPFSYSVDSWRWNLYNGSIAGYQMNTGWWNIRLHQQGLCPPVKRTEDDLDPLSKYHVAANLQYIHYFSGKLLEFQLHKSLCDAAGHVGPLHKCDIYGSTNAGNLLRSVLSKGSSLPLSDIIKMLTEGKEDMLSTSAFLLYFEPLTRWLEKQNVNETIGWFSDDSTICPSVESVEHKASATRLSISNIFIFLFLYYSIMLS